MGDVEDVEVYAAHPIHDWITNTDKGQWVFERCKDLSWHSLPNHNYGYTIAIRGSLTDRDATEYYLRFPD